MKGIQQQLDDVQAHSKQEVTNIRRQMERERKKLDQAHETTVRSFTDMFMFGSCDSDIQIEVTTGAAETTTAGGASA